MLRLAHRILSQPFVIPNRTSCPENLAWVRMQETAASVLREQLRQRPVPVIIADNVANYYGLHPRQSWALTDFPCVAPPFPTFIVSWQPPEVTVLSDSVMTRDQQDALETGWLVSSMSVGLGIKMVQSHRGGFGGDESPDDLLAKASAAKWFILSLHLGALKDGRPIWLGDSIGVFIGDDGTPLSSFELPSPVRIENTGDTNVFKHFHVAMFAMQFMNCKNVSRLDATETEGPPKKWCRRMKVPELKYHTLLIDPNLSAKPRGQSSTGGAGEDRSGKALHICRGHFRTYAEGGPGLFGSGRTGTFWVPSHTRGSSEHGSVTKDYTIGVPAA